jgi:hypothetical protein
MEPDEAQPVPMFVGTHAAHLREKYVRCGKPGCTKCPHGPYTYLSYREGKTVKTQYLGRGSVAQFLNEQRTDEEGKARK